MENIKSIVIFENETSGKYIHVIKSLKEDNKGKQYVGTDFVTFDKKQDFLPGQEVVIGRIMTSQGIPGPKTIFAKELNKKANFADQYKRLYNLKYMLEMEMATDDKEILWDEYKMQHEKASYNDFVDDFVGWYQGRLSIYQEAATSILVEGLKYNQAGEFIRSDIEEKKVCEATDVFNYIFNEIEIASRTEDDINAVIKKTAEECCKDKYIDKYFVIVSMLLNHSKVLVNSNKSGKKR